MTMESILEDLYSEHLSHYISRDLISKDNWNMFRDHIKTHKYWLNEDYENEIPLSSAYQSWLEYVFEPFLYSVNQLNLTMRTHLTVVELYHKIMQDWYFMKSRTPKKVKHIRIDHAVQRYSDSLGDLTWWDKIKLKILK